MAYDHLTRAQLEHRCSEAERRLMRYEHTHGQPAATGSVDDEPPRWEVVAPDATTRPKPPP